MSFNFERYKPYTDENILKYTQSDDDTIKDEIEKNCKYLEFGDQNHGNGTLIQKINLDIFSKIQFKNLLYLKISHLNNNYDLCKILDIILKTSIKLKEIIFYNNEIDKLPDSILSLKRLDKLYFIDSNIYSFPLILANLNKTYIYFDNNSVKH